MIWNKLNAKIVVLLQEYMHRDVYDTHLLHVINDTQLMTESVVDDRFASSHMPHHSLHGSAELL